MTQYSMFWEGCAVGDALLAPYTAKMYRSLWDKALIHDAEKFAPIACTPDGAGLKVSIGGADQLDLSEGSAMIDGVYYWTDGVSWSLDRPGSGYYAYTVVLRKAQLEKTLKAELVGPIPYLTLTLLRLSGWGAINQSNTVWEVPIAYALANSGSGLLAVHDLLHRIGPNHSQIPALIYRQGNSGSEDWNSQGTDDTQLNENNKVQVGTIEWTGGAATSGNKAVTFPYPFTNVPVCFAAPQSGGIETATQQNTTTLTIYWRCMGASTYTSVKFFWMAIGRKDKL